jgi:hypothetical protein
VNFKSSKNKTFEAFEAFPIKYLKSRTSLTAVTYKIAPPTVQILKLKKHTLDPVKNPEKIYFGIGNTAVIQPGSELALLGMWIRLAPAVNSDLNS